MFKKFNPKEDVASATLVKSSVQRNIRAKLLDQYPYLSEKIGGAPAAPVAAAPEPEQEEPEEAAPKKKAGKNKKKEATKETKDTGGASEIVLDLIWPKKEAITLVKCREHLSIITLQGEPLFFQHFDDAFLPTLKLLHQYPDLLPHTQVDRGAIKFVLGGANIMCPGLTSEKGALPSQDYPVGTPVAVHAYGKENALAVGVLNQSIEDIRTINKNIGINTMCYLGDDLWRVGKL